MIADSKGRYGVGKVGRRRDDKETPKHETESVFEWYCNKQSMKCCLGIKSNRRYSGIFLARFSYTGVLARP